MGFVSERISALINDHNISERQLSVELGHTEGYINKVTSGKLNISVNELLNICEYFQITPSQFFQGHDEYSPRQFHKLSSILQREEDDIKQESIEALIEDFLPETFR